MLPFCLTPFIIQLMKFKKNLAGSKTLYTHDGKLDNLLIALTNKNS